MFCFSKFIGLTFSLTVVCIVYTISLKLRIPSSISCILLVKLTPVVLVCIFKFFISIIHSVLFFFMNSTSYFMSLTV